MIINSISKRFKSMKQIANWISSSDLIVAFTGAGISTESGIPDFRSPGGVWAQSKPVMFDDFVRNPESRYEYWRQKSVSHRDFFDNHPNAGHQVLAKWQQHGSLSRVITQNIDGLHQEAGSTNVVELHGTAREISCLDCHARFGAEEMVNNFLRDDSVPPCPRCETGLLKHATISFGQSLDADVLNTAFRLASDCDLLLAMGSSLVVEPAASIPRVVHENGGKLLIINRDSTPLDGIADAVVNASIGQTLTDIDEELNPNTV